MKKCLLFVIIIFGCLSANAQEENDTWVSVAKMNWEDIDEIPYEELPDGESGENPRCGMDLDMAIMELVAEGLAVMNPTQKEDPWQSCAIVLADFPLESRHDYILRLTIKVPSDGTFFIGFGSWIYEIMRLVPVKRGDDFQVIDVEYPEYKNKLMSTYGTVLLGCGWVVGTTILKEVEILERTSLASIQSVKTAKRDDDVIYNLTGQKVDTSYKGIVIQNGKKVVK